MSVKTAVRVLEVFNLFAEVQRPMIYSDISRKLNIPLSSCYALLNTMVSMGYLYAPGIRTGYYPTQRLLHVARAISSVDPLITLFTPLLIKLRDLTAETTVLAKLANDQVVYLKVVESNQTIRYSHQPGGFKLLHATASGKALLSALSENKVKQLLDKYENWEQVTTNTLKTRLALEADIKEGISRGWQRSFGENVEDVMAIAKGFKLHEEAFCLVIAGPLSRVKRNEEKIASSLLSIHDEIPKIMGLP